jgi:uncharacterized protein YjbI with pentapeptide repeats
MKGTRKLALFNRGVGAWNQWRANNPTEQPNFNGMDLSRIRLQGAHLSRINLSLVNLSHVDLSRAYLNETLFHGANLKGTNLSRAHLIEAQLCETDLSEANLSHAYLMGANLSSANLTRADLSQANLRATNFQQTNLEKANLDGTDLRGILLNHTNFRGAYLREANLRGKNLSGNTFEQADLRRANLHKANLKKVIMKEADLRGADLREADLCGVDLRGAQLGGANLGNANLRGANLAKADLKKADLSGANCQGTDFKNADLRDAILTGVNLRGANLNGVLFKGAEIGHNPLQPPASEPAECTRSDMMTLDAATVQANLTIVQPGEPLISVDNFEVVQAIHTLLNNRALRQLLDTVSLKVVLVFARLTAERKIILDSIREALRKRDYLPVLFDLGHAGSPDFTETIATLVHLARFVIADFTDVDLGPEEIPHILQTTNTPVQPLLWEKMDEEPLMLFNLRHRQDSVLETYRYRDARHLFDSLETQVIAPAEAQARAAERGRA